MFIDIAHTRSSVVWSLFVARLRLWIFHLAGKQPVALAFVVDQEEERPVGNVCVRGFAAGTIERLHVVRHLRERVRPQAFEVDHIDQRNDRALETVGRYDLPQPAVRVLRHPVVDGGRRLRRVRVGHLLEHCVVVRVCDLLILVDHLDEVVHEEVGRNVQIVVLVVLLGRFEQLLVVAARMVDVIVLDDGAKLPLGVGHGIAEARVGRLVDECEQNFHRKR